MKRISSVKPMYIDYNSTNGPYYDPFNIHVHRWVINYLDYAQSQNSNEISYNNKVNKIVKYCEICHQLSSSNELSTTKLTSTESINRIQNNTNEINYTDNYDDYKGELIYTHTNINKQFENIDIDLNEYTTLFHKKLEINNNYISK